MTRERPIIFSAPMVRAILDGRKTQARRIVKQATGPSLSVNMAEDDPAVAELSWLHGDGPGHEVHETIQRVRSPYGAPGDRLWVRETFMHEPADYCWEASVSIPSRPASTVYRADYPESRPGEGWKPSIHMPRELSRITLEITAVRVERLQEISETDAMAEGVEPMLVPPDGGSCPHVEGFRVLWEQINGPDSWDANPWVWVIEFRRIAA